MSSIKARNVQFEICSALGIIYVLMEHVWMNSDSELRGLIFLLEQFFMPLFFFISGFFFKREYLSDKVSFCSKKFKRLIVPTIIILCFYQLLYLALHESGDVSLFDKLTSLLLCVFCKFNFHWYSGSLWFVAALFYSQVIFILVSGLLQKLSSVKLYQYIYILVFSSIALIGIYDKHTSLLFMQSCYGCYFYAAGSLFVKYLERFNRVPLFEVIKVSLMIEVLLLIVNYGNALPLNMIFMNLSGIKYKFLALIVPFNFIAITLSLANYLSKKSGDLINLLSVIGKNTYSIMAYHQFVWLCFGLLLIKIAGVIGIDIPAGFSRYVIDNSFVIISNPLLYIIVGISVPIFLTKLYKRYITLFREKFERLKVRKALVVSDA